MKVSGELQLAFIAAYKMFSESPDPEGKERKLKGFSVIFDVSEETVSVTFLAMFPDGLEPNDEILRSLPVDVTYDVSRETHEVLHWNYNRQARPPIITSGTRRGHFGDRRLSQIRNLSGPTLVFQFDYSYSPRGQITGVHRKTRHYW